MAKQGKTEAWFACPHCGAKLPQSAKSCRHCGSDAETGWAEDADWYGADAAYNSDEDQDFYEREFPDEYSSTRTRWIKAILMLLAIVFVFIALREMGLR